MDKLFIVMPAYNEQDTIEDVVKSWYEVLKVASDDSRLVIADSGSTDRTHDILLSLKNKLPKIVILSDTIKYHGPKLIAMYKYAIKEGSDFIFQTDSDGQTNPSEFYNFWNERKDFDAILGYRKVRGDGIIRKFVENTVCFLLNIYFGVRVKDANAPFRLMKSSVVSKYIDRFSEDYNLPNIMLTTFLSYYKHKIKFNVVTFKPRQGGVNSINIKKIVDIGVKALSDFANFKKTM